MASSFKTLREYLYQDGKTFVVPNYQRGYKWSVKSEKENTPQPSHVEKLCDDLFKAYRAERPEYFLQGITVSENARRIVLIDGQQRTTTLYLLLWCFDERLVTNIRLDYDIREKSKEFIHSFKESNFNPWTPPVNDDNQDIHYFRAAVEQIRAKQKDISENHRLSFQSYILDHVKILYINIDHDKAVKTFTMMNGNKATMLPEELIKAEMLRLVSLPSPVTEEPLGSAPLDCEEKINKLKIHYACEWETNALRSRYAREWDKWLYWWNRAEVKAYFDVEHPMGLLLEYEFKREMNDQPYTFQTFKENVNGKQVTVREQFNYLRKMQKNFEDLYNAPKMYNYLKLALICAEDKDDKFKIIQHFMLNKISVDTVLRDYAKWRLVGATHKQITQSGTLGSDRNTLVTRAQDVLEQLSDKFVYDVCNDWALKQLLRLNVEEDNRLDGAGRKFDFNIYGTKSLEHVHPKSKAYHKDGDRFYDGNKVDLGSGAPNGQGWINRDMCGVRGSEHCIGNLVLLDKNDNSKFNNKPFELKKKIYFDVTEGFKSRNLLHSISVFAKSKWDEGDIQESQKAFIARFKKDYNLQEGGPNA